MGWSALAQRAMKSTFKQPKKKTSIHYQQHHHCSTKAVVLLVLLVVFLPGCWSDTEVLDEILTSLTAETERVQVVVKLCVYKRVYVYWSAGPGKVVQKCTLHCI